jgi:hypothetical protein
VVLFLLITLAMTYFAAQLKVDAGFRNRSRFSMNTCRPSSITGATSVAPIVC